MHRTNHGIIAARKCLVHCLLTVCLPACSSSVTRHFHRCSCPRSAVEHCIVIAIETEVLIHRRPPFPKCISVAAQRRVGACAVVNFRLKLGLFVDGGGAASRAIQAAVHSAPSCIFFCCSLGLSMSSILSSRCFPNLLMLITNAALVISSFRSSLFPLSFHLSISFPSHVLSVRPRGVD